MIYSLRQTVFTLALTALLVCPASAQAPHALTGTVADRSGGVWRRPRWWPHARSSS